MATTNQRGVIPCPMPALQRRNGCAVSWWRTHWSEVVNAATMVPGIVVAAMRLRSMLAKRRRRPADDRPPTASEKEKEDLVPSKTIAVAVASFVPLCVVSIAHHLVDGSAHPRSKRRSLRADYTMQQLCAMMHALAAHRDTPRRRGIAVAAVAALSSATWMFDVTDNVGQASVLALQSAIVGVACSFRVSRWWVAALATRLGSAWAAARGRRQWRERGGEAADQPVALMLMHGAFHLFAIAAFDDLWSALEDRKRSGGALSSLSSSTSNDGDHVGEIEESLVIHWRKPAGCRVWVKEG